MVALELSETVRAAFNRDGFVIARNLASKELCGELKDIAQEHLSSLIAPVEYELDVSYPGAPIDSHADGADTSRRLLQVYARDASFRQWAIGQKVHSVLTQLFSKNRGEGKQGEEKCNGIALSQCHHNCIMTKAPGFSSATLWHQDNRYWSFDRQDLISVWLALGDENRSNGCLRVIPGSHKWDLEPGQFDASLFLRPDLPENKALIAAAVLVELNEGDVLFFHSCLFHAAGRNLSSEHKFSLVYTYHEDDNHPIRNTRSARYPSVSL